ncbi:MAG: hypothetical protein GY719_10965 [bacterium]|nr:hypothetical protein [bacterium]
MPILKRETDLYPGDLFEAYPGQADWTVARVRSRREKALARYLLQHGLPFYLPQTSHERRYSGRLRVSHLPLFPGYVFLRLGRRDHRNVLKSNLVLQLLDVFDQSQLHRELRSLWQLQLSGAPLVPHPYLAPGDEVKIADGPFAGWTGHLLRERGNLQWVVSITLLRRSVAATLDRESIVPATMGTAAGRDRLAHPLTG